MAKGLADMKCRMMVGVMHLAALAAACASNATMALVEYRRQFGFPLTSWSESYFGDIAGIEGLLGIKYENEKKLLLMIF